jgi:hypothetical protein
MNMNEDIINNVKKSIGDLCKGVCSDVSFNSINDYGVSLVHRHIW